MKPRGRSWIGLVALFGCSLTVACTQQNAAQGPVQPPDTAIARFAPGGEVTVVEVDVSDRRPLRSASLVGPNAEIVQAYSITSTRALLYEQTVSPPSSGTIGLSIGGFGFGGHNAYGGGVGVTAPIDTLGGTTRQPVMSSQLQSTALLRLPDPGSYRQDWRLYQIRLQVGDPPDANIVTLPAPQPPGNL